MRSERKISNIVYNQNAVTRALRKLTTYIVRISPPGVRKKISSFGLLLDRIVDVFHKAPNPAITKKITTNLKDEIKTFNINGKYVPCIVGDHLNNSVLYRTGLSYKRYRPYKLWHLPVEQFVLMRKLYAAEPKMMIKPLCLVLDKHKKPIGFLMKKATGKSLEELIRSGKLSYKDSLKIEKTIESFISRLHKKKLSHGDLNPNNIIINEKTAVKLIDPLELTPKRVALSDDYAWLKHLKKRLHFYRRLNRKAWINETK